MPVNVGDIIKASNFNTIQAKVDKVLGASDTSDPTFGYGQAVNSAAVSALTDVSIPNGDSVTADQVNNLLDDLKTIYKHQTGSDEQTNTFLVGEIIGSNSSGTEMIYDSDGSRSINQEDVEKGFNDLETLIDNLTNSRFTLAASQSETANIISDSRTRDWNNSVFSEFTVSFSSAAERRHFFNAGGEIRISGTVDLSTSTGNSLSRDQGWNALLENVSTVIFNHNSANDTGNAGGISKPNGDVGNFQLTSSYQSVIRKDASSGVYSNSFWSVEAKNNSDSEISFKVTLVDNGPEGDPDAGDIGSISGGINEPITADINFLYGYRKADGAVVVPTPTFSLVEDFDVNLNTDPVVATPSNQSPNNNQIVPTNLPFSLSASAFNVLNGSDTHESTQWFVKKTTDSFDNPILYTESSSDLTSIELEPELFDDVRGSAQDYEWYVRYKGTNLGWTPWSSGTTFTSSVYAEFNITIDSSTANYNFYDEVRNQANWNGTQQLQGSLTITSLTKVGALDTSGNAFTVDRIPNNSNITIQNNGVIVGAGGKGGSSLSSGVTPGQPGGTALKFDSVVQNSNINLVNNGEVWGGGGGGGAANDQDSAEIYRVSGGGGSGIPRGPGGDIDPGNNIRISFGKSARNYDEGGEGGFQSYEQSKSTIEIEGGDAGFNQARLNGAAGFSSGGNASNGGAGGTAIEGSSFITISVIGLIQGSTT